MMFGGRHERERRAGTENVAGAVALGRAAEWIGEHGDAENRRQAALRDRLEQSILDRIPDTHVNGAGAPRVPNTTNIRFDGIDSDALLIALDLKGFAVSSGAACSSGAPEPSHVLLAMGLSRLRGPVEHPFFAGAIQYRRAGGRAGGSAGRLRHASAKAGAGVCLRIRSPLRCPAAWIAPWSRGCCVRAARTSSA